MSFFDIVGASFFKPLTSSYKEVYFDCLNMIYDLCKYQMSNSEEKGVVVEIAPASGCKSSGTGVHTDHPAFVDDTILHAISLHTTGGAGMTIFDELLYLSDYIEPTRTYPECLALREYFWGGYEGAADKELHLHRTVRRALWDTVEELRGKNIVVFPATLDALSYFDRIVQDREKN